MPINPLVLELLLEVTESGRSPEEACADRPELLGELRACLRQLTLVRDELDVLFPEADKAEPVPSAGPRPAIPGYQVGEVLGRGGMGVVYAARHLRLNRPVAVKMMLVGAFAAPAELARFQQEAEALAALEHPNIVRVYDVGEVGGLPYFTMEFLDGGNLSQKLGGIPQTARAAATLMVLLADAVEAAHRGGVVHRDLKPSNILLTARGAPKITDFGLARRFEAGVGLSMTGARIGTPAYMAPEQAAGAARVSGPATDVYALGAILYEMLTGRPPFLAETIAETERQVQSEDPAPPSRMNAKVPRDLETICLKCLQKQPGRRYSSAAELGEDLGRFLRGEPIRARPVCSLERAGKWVRRHPVRTLAIFGTLAISAAAIAVGWWLLSARSLVTHAIEDDLRVATGALRRSNWGEARSALERARARLGPGEFGGLRRRLDRADRDQELVGRLAEIRSGRISQNKGGAAHWAEEYEGAFRTFGLLDPAEAPRVAADRLKGSDVKDALVAAIDDWALCANFNNAGGRPDVWNPDARRKVEAWLLDVARRVDPDPRGWRDRLRDPSVRRDRRVLGDLAASARIDATPVHLLVSLGELLQTSGGDATPFLLSVQQQYPDDLWVNYLLGTCALDRDDPPDALRNFQAALATRPEAAFLNYKLGQALLRVGRRDESIAYYRKAARLDPEDAMVRLQFGNVLGQVHRIPEAIEQFNRGLALTEDAAAHVMFRRGLRRCYALSGDAEALRAVWLRSIEARPPIHEDWDGYAEFCLDQGRPEEYRALCLRLLETFGATEHAHVAERTGRACLLAPASPEVLAKATDLVDRALAGQASKPGWAGPYFQFAKGLADYRQGRLEEAIRIMDGPASGALQPAPRLVSAMARHRLGRETEALRAFAVAILLGDWEKSRATDREQWMFHILRREAESMMLPDLPAFLAGAYRPGSDVEKVCLLGACQFEGRYLAASELFAEALATDAGFAADPNLKMRRSAAGAAALAGSGRGRDAGGLDASGRLRLRNRARDWLRADLAALKRIAKVGAGGLREFLESTASHWANHPDLAGLRDPDACPGLTPAEQGEFRALCEELRGLIATLAK